MSTTAIMSAIAIAVFFGVMFVIGIRCRRHATNVNDYVLGGRAVGPWLTAFAFGTSYFSAVIFVGYAGQFGWNFGMASTWIGLGNAFIGSLLAWVVLGRRTRLMTQHIGSRTMPDFFDRRYDSKKLKIAASVIVFIFLIPYTASLYNGLSSLFHIAFNVPYWICIAVIAVLTGLYVIFGGYMATAINDFIQGIIMLVGIVAVIGAVLADRGGLLQAMNDLSQIPSEYSDTAGMQGAFTSFLGAQPFYLLVVVLLTSLGTWGLPQMVGKFYSIKNEDAVKKGTIISTLFAVVVAGGCYFLGGFGRLFLTPEQLSVGGYDSIIPTMMERLPSAIVAVVIVLVLSASMSTLSSLVLTSSSTLTLDVILPACRRESSEKTKVSVMRIFVAFFVVVSAVLAILKDAFPQFTFIAQMMGVSWGALAGAFLAPFLYGLYWKRTTRPAVAVSFVFGVGVEVIQLLCMMKLISFPSDGFFGLIFRNSLYSGVFAMLGSIILVPVVSLLTKKPDSARVDEMFSCYNTTVTVEAHESLGK